MVCVVRLSSYTWIEIGLNALGVGRHCSMAFSKSKSQRRKIKSNTERFRWGNKCASISIALSEMRPVDADDKELSESVMARWILVKLANRISHTGGIRKRLHLHSVCYVCWCLTWFRDGHAEDFTWRQWINRFPRFIRRQSHCNRIFNSLLSFQCNLWTWWDVRKREMSVLWMRNRQH